MTDSTVPNDPTSDASAPPPPLYAGTPWAAPAPPAPPAPPAAPEHRHRHRGGVGVGLLLVALGVLLLVTQFVPGLAWWTLWPLLIVVGGLVQMVTPGHDRAWDVNRLFDGIGTTLFGLVLLGNTTGFISWGVWWVLLTLWPVLLIAIGLSILGRGLGQSWLRLLGPVAVWLALAYAVAVSLTGAGGLVPMTAQVQTAGRVFAVSEPLSGATQAKLQFKGGAGDIAIKSGSNLVLATGRSPYGTPQLTVDRTGTLADVALTLGSPAGISAPAFGAATVNLALADQPMWDLSLETGASNLDADLSNIDVRQLDVTTGVGSTTLKLGRVTDDPAGSFARIKAGVSSVTILIPKGVEAIVDTHNGLTGTSFDSAFSRQSGGVWQTSGYTSDAKAWHISTESGISSVSIRTY